MRTPAIAIVLLISSTASGQTIDFESLPGGLPVTDGMLIRDQYDLEPYWVRFELVDQDSAVGPRLAEVGPPLTAFWKDEAIPNPCITGESRRDIPAPGEPVGCFFLTDDGQQGTPPDVLLVTYTHPVHEASGQIIDIDTGPVTTDEWTITAYGSDSVTVLAQTVLRAGDAGTGDGVASLWELTTPEDIHFITISYTGTTGAGVGFALDNFSPSSIPVSGRASGRAASWGRVKATYR